MKARAWRQPISELPSLIDTYRQRFPPDWELLSYRDRVTASPRRTTEGLDETIDGRAFSTDAELRWRVDAGVAHAVGIVPEVDRLPEGLEADLELGSVEEGSHFLFGRADDARLRWVDGRIPDDLPYEFEPTTAAGRILVDWERFEHEGEPAFERFIRLRAGSPV